MKSYLTRLVERAALRPQTRAVSPPALAREREIAVQPEDPFAAGELLPPTPTAAQPTLALSSSSPAAAPPSSDLRPPRDISPPPRPDSSAPPVEMATEETRPPARHVEPPPEPERPTPPLERGPTIEVSPPSRVDAPAPFDEAEALRAADAFMERLLGRSFQHTFAPQPHASTPEPTTELGAEGEPDRATLRPPPPAETPSLPAATPSLVINQLRIDVVEAEPRPAPPLRVAPRGAPLRAGRGGRLAPPSGSRFGLGQV